LAKAFGPLQTDRWLPLTSAEPKIGADCPAAAEKGKKQPVLPLALASREFFKPATASSVPHIVLQHVHNLIITHASCLKYLHD